LVVCHRRLAGAEEAEEAEKFLLRQERQRDEEDLGLQLLAAMSIFSRLHSLFILLFLRFLREFIEFLVEFLVQPLICSCCNRGVEESWWKSGVLDCGGGMFWWSGWWVEEVSGCG
jgi:hypothetical protein